jgi:hypothetical protein
MKDYFYLVKIQYCYASILSERMNREIEEKEMIQSRRIQRKWERKKENGLRQQRV